MAAPISRVRLARRAVGTEELSITVPHRTSSLAETAPFRRSSAGTRCEQFGPYLVYEQLGEGGMAYVHRAELVGGDGFRKTVALKRMRTEWTADQAFIRSFVDEAQLASRLHHPNIAQAYDLGKVAGTYYIAMELVLGHTLSQVMTQSRRAAGAVPLPIALEILIQLCDALDHAHDLRDEGGRPLELVHRDVSPANVIVSREGVIKLIDFGIAKARSSRVATEAGVCKGKHAYVAPEYTYGHLDRRADLWGLGVVAHELLTGRRLFVASTDVATIRNVRAMPISPPSRYASAISRELDDIVMTALQRDPALRWQNAGAMRVALTTEARKLGPLVSGAQIRGWTEWAFVQQPRRTTSIASMLETLEPSIAIGDLEPAGPAATRAPTAPIAPPPRQPAIEPPGAPRVAPRVAPPAAPAAAPSAIPPAARPATPPAARAPTSPTARTPRHAAIDRRAARLAAPVRRSSPRPGRGGRRPRWQPPTRWTRAPRHSSASPLVLCGLIVFVALACHLGWIDLERWRDLLA